MKGVGEMLRSILSIILLIMIFVTASGLPLYADTIDFNFNFSLPIATSREDITIIDTNVTMLSPSDSKIQMNLMVNKKFLPLQLDGKIPLTLSLYSNEFIGSFDITEIDISQGDDVQIEFHIPQSLLDIPNGDYQLEISLNIKDVEIPITSPKVSLNFSREFTYVKTLEGIDRSESALTLYFPDNNMNYLIPITRVIPYTKALLRNTVTNLAKGPSDSLGLPTNSPIPNIRKLNLKGGTLSVYLPKDIGIYNEYATSARIAVDSLVNSLTAIEGVKELQFYFNNKILMDNFHGMAMDKPIYPSNSPKFYVALITDTKRALLMPISMDIQSPSIEEVFEGLKYGTSLIPYNYTLQPTIPKEVVLLDYTIENKTLQLKLNEKFLTVYKNDPDKRNLMIDSIIYTFTSLNNIDNIILQVPNSDLAISEGILLDKILVPSPYINPEK